MHILNAAYTNIPVNDLINIHIAWYLWYIYLNKPYKCMHNLNNATAKVIENVVINLSNIQK